MKIDLKNVRLSFSNFDLHLNIQMEGDVIGLFGPSGSGKTTLLDLISGIKEPKTGRIQLDDDILTDQQRSYFVSPRARKIGYVPQEGALFPHLTVRSNILFASQSEENSDVLFEHVVEVLNIHSILNRKPRNLSGGERQRVSLARALLYRPRLLLLDEPLSSLDEALKVKSLDLLRRVHSDFSIPMIYVSHRVAEIRSLCDKTMIIQQGNIVAHGETSEIFKNQRDQSQDYS